MTATQYTALESIAEAVEFLMLSATVALPCFFTAWIITASVLA